ncbi:PhoH family protein [Piscirickettsia salmonis]|uniref:PhoH family protein n=1 Tax=Piscirickettsia salmonis TaxID=1238 RepID=UPI000332C89D|nr:PhoH family protein [Piscirickettsia salmonis]ERL63409.1 AAA domain protein [Piscirickettsia salmonis LF-89 = ATCC VR-1361]
MAKRKNRQLDDEICALNSKPNLRSPHYLKQIKALTHSQESLFKAWNSGNEVMIAHGSAGTGKTYLATYLALKALLEYDSPYSRIAFFRSTVPAREQGYLKGDLEDKEAPYKQVFIDAVNELLDMKNPWSTYSKYGFLEFYSTSFQRGTNYHDTLLIVDECQNMGLEELDMIMTRVGNHSRIIFCGDTEQDDLRYRHSDSSGFCDFIHIINQMQRSQIIEFTIEDIVRSYIVKDYLYAKSGAYKGQTPPPKKTAKEDNLIHYPFTPTT